MEGLGGARLGVFEALSLSGPDGSNGLDVDGGDGGQRAAPLPRVGLRCLRETPHPDRQHRLPALWCEKRMYLRYHFMLKMIVLPRHARDKHRESTQKEMRFSQARRNHQV